MYEISKELETLGNKVIGKYPEFNFIPDNDIHIIYQKTDRPKRKNGGIVYADCTKVTDKMKAVTNADFIITFYAASEHLDAEQREILMRHELKHVGYKNGSCRIVPHDVEDFSDIISKYGLDWTSND